MNEDMIALMLLRIATALPGLCVMGSGRTRSPVTGLGKSGMRDRKGATTTLNDSKMHSLGGHEQPGELYGW